MNIQNIKEIVEQLETAQNQVNTLKDRLAKELEVTNTPITVEIKPKPKPKPAKTKKTRKPRARNVPVAEIQAAIAEGKTKQEIAKQFNISYATVCRNAKKEIANP